MPHHSIEEEIAAEEFEELQELEKQRVARMLGEAGDENSEDEGDRRGKKRRKGDSTEARRRTDDDLEEGFYIDTKTGIIMPPEMDQDGEESNADDDDNDDGDDDDHDDGMDAERRARAKVVGFEHEEDLGDDDDDDDGDDGSDEDDAEMSSDGEEEGGEFGKEESDGELDSDSESEDEEDDGASGATKKRKTLREKAIDRAAMAEAAAREMPYVIECPMDMDAFNDLIVKHTKNAKDMGELVSRIRKCSALMLNPSKNKAKLHAL